MPARAPATAGVPLQPSAAARISSFFISITSCMGWWHDSLPEHPELRGKQREAERSGLACPARRVCRTAVGSRDHRRMKEQAAVLGSFCERPSHERRCLTNLPGRGQRPRQRIEREDVAAIFQFTSGEIDGLSAVLTPRRQVEGERARVAGSRRLAPAASRAQPLRRFGSASGARRQAPTGIQAEG